MKGTTWSGLGALLLALLLFFWSQSDDAPQPADHDVVRSERTDRQRRTESGTTPRTFSLRGPLQKEERKTHEAADLIEFYHPRIELEDVTLSEGLARLMDEYRRICEETGETVLPLRWKIDGAPQMIPRISLEGRFLDSCRLLGVWARMTCEIKDGTLVFTEVQPGPMQARTYTVPPTFPHHFERWTGRQLTIETSGEVPAPSPFSLPADLDLPSAALLPSDPPDALDLTTDLRNSGILEDLGEVTFQRSNSRLEINTGPGTRQLLELLLEMTMTPPSQIHYEAQLMVDGEPQKLPRLMTLSGQKATIETGREYVEIREGEVIKTMVGEKLEIQGELFGFGERSVVNFTHTAPPSASDLARYQETGRLADLNLETTEIMGHEIIKQAAGRFDGVQGGAIFSPEGELTFVLTSQRTDATGQALPGPMTTPEPE